MAQDGRFDFSNLWSSTRYRAAVFIVVFCMTVFLFVMFHDRKTYSKFENPLPADVCPPAQETYAQIPRVKNGIQETYPLPNPFYLHYVRFKPDKGETKLRFIDYLSVMSAVQFLKPDGILVHGDFEPDGEYWDQLKSKGLIRHVHREKTTNAGQRQGKPKVVAFMEHAADMAKLDVLLEYGGVAVDFDVFFVRGERVREILSRKKALLCFGDIDGYNIGFIGAHKDSKLLYAWRRSYKDIYVNDWNFNQAFVTKYLAILFHEETYVADRICNNPHPDRNLGSYFHKHGEINWKDSIAIHSYERFGGVPITAPADLEGKLTSHKELLRTIYQNLTLPLADLSLKEEIDPLTSELL